MRLTESGIRMIIIGNAGVNLAFLFRALARENTRSRRMDSYIPWAGRAAEA